MIKAHEYNRIKYLTFDLVNAYHSVNDKDTLAAVCAQVVSEISSFGDFPGLTAKLSDQRLTTEQAEKLMAELKGEVEAFPLPSNLSKVFKKVKKLKVPELPELQGLSYLGWNEVASGRKYIVTADGQGFYGNITGQTKNICAICQKTSIVTQFMATTKSSGDGTYTRNGNYICLDSELCNRQMQQLDGLNNFISTIKAR